MFFLADFVSQGPLRAYVSGYSADSSVCRMTLLEQQAESSVTRAGSEPSLNRSLVELGYAEAVPGSSLDVELQLERTMNDPEKLEQLGGYTLLRVGQWENVDVGYAVE